MCGEEQLLNKNVIDWCKCFNILTVAKFKKVKAVEPLFLSILVHRSISY